MKSHFLLDCRIFLQVLTFVLTVQILSVIKLPFKTFFLIVLF
jgi:hypothetical protein